LGTGVGKGGSCVDQNKVAVVLANRRDRSFVAKELDCNLEVGNVKFMYRAGVIAAVVAPVDPPDSLVAERKFTYFHSICLKQHSSLFVNQWRFTLRLVADYCNQSTAAEAGVLPALWRQLVLPADDN
jgi:hypothetical protein